MIILTARVILDSHSIYMWVRKSKNPKWQNQVLFEAAAVLFKVLLKKMEGIIKAQRH